MQKETVLIQGRFQIVTVQHKEMIDEELNNDRNVVIQIIEGNKSSEDKSKNPMDFLFRKNMFETVYEKETKNNTIQIFKYKTQYLPFIVYDLEKTENIIITHIKSGMDRCKSYKQQFENIKSESDIYEYIQNKKINFICMDRSNDSISQSKQRKQIFNGDFKAQEKLVPKELIPYFNNIKNYLVECLISEILF